jgi:hypothetical protein
MAHHPRILVNHIGYDSRAPKRAVLQLLDDRCPARFTIVDADTDAVVHTGNVPPAQPVDQWHGGRFATLDFTDVQSEGCYRLETELPGGTVSSSPFAIAPHLLVQQTVSDIIAYFKGQRHTRLYDAADANATFAGERAGTVDVRGGWCDATADWSCNLSHLNHASYMNPQQAPLPVWTMIEAAELLQRSDAPAAWQLIDRLREEAAWGADKLVRMLDPSGYFYEMAIYLKNEQRTEICDSTYAWGKTRHDTYQAGFRQGGGMAIAALARAAAAGLAYTFTSEQYLDAAQRGFEHLLEHNCEYLNDGRENIIDDYCALLAACELYAATGDRSYAEYADQRAAALRARVTDQGWLRADDTGARPFFHAADEGLPLVALQRYKQMQDAGCRMQDTMLRIAEYQRSITDEVPNPFGYARQLVKAVHEPEMRTAFFMPHDNETEYWWQGENARIASLAAAHARAAHGAPEGIAFAQRQIDWILGLNPFDMCMLHGKGRNNVNFSPGFPNAPGGIYNGITAAIDNERDIAFMTGPHADDPRHTWRWNEQWIPHAAWFLLAVVELDAALGAGGNQ